MSQDESVPKGPEDDLKFAAAKAEAEFIQVANKWMLCPKCIISYGIVPLNPVVKSVQLKREIVPRYTRQYLCGRCGYLTSPLKRSDWDRSIKKWMTLQSRFKEMSEVNKDAKMSE